MSKTNRMYKIFMTVMVTIIAGLLLACGVIAVKNSMRVKMSIPANPNFLIEIYIQKDGEDTQNLVFKNFGEVQIQNGISGLNANTLVASDDFVTLYGGDFSIIIKNYTTTMGILASITSTATMDGDVPGVPAEITAVKAIAAAYDAVAEEAKFQIANKAVLPQQTLFEIKFEELKTLDVSFSGENTSTGNVETTINYGSNYSQTFTAQDGYAFNENITVTGVEEGGYSWTPNGQTGVFTITDWSKVTGPISISLNAVQSGYTITYNSNGGNGTMEPSEYQLGVPSFLKANTFTMAQGIYHSAGAFAGWNTAADGSGTTYNAGDSIIITKDTTLYAMWDYAWIIKEYDGINTDAWSGYYCVEFGEYPQNIREDDVAILNENGTDITSTTVTGTIGYDIDGGKYYYQEKEVSGKSGWYKFEPIRWIIIATSGELTDTATYGIGASKHADMPIASENKKQLLLLSEFGLYREYFDKEFTTNQFGSADCDIRVSLNGSFAEMAGINQYFASTVGVNEVGKYIAKVQPGTTYSVEGSEEISPGEKAAVEQFDDENSYNMFLLGDTNGSDSNIDTYHWSDYLNSTQMRCVASGFAETTGSENNYGACYWWLRSGKADGTFRANCVDNSANVIYRTTASSDLSVRPAFVLDLA